jgi:hypothetical protein
VRRFLRLFVTFAVLSTGIAWVWGVAGGAGHGATTGSTLTVPSAAGVPHGHLGMTMPMGLAVPELGGLLPAATTHGLAMRLRQYPDLSLATAAQRVAARTLLQRLRATALPWRDVRAAAAAGFDVRRPRRRPGETRVMWFHSENRAWHSDRRYLDPRHPDTLIYADLPGRPLELVGVMISMPRGLRGPTPGGPITRWHSHLVCVLAGRRGVKPLPSGSCPTGARLVQGSEMMHVWFTRDLRSAFAIHAPGPELCNARLLAGSICRHPSALHAM